jgi:cyanophycin synthetase
MGIDTSADVVRVNARRTDIFDLFNFKDYIGSNPFLNTAACTFDFAFTGYREPLPIADYVEKIGDRYPHLREEKYESHAHLFARNLLEVSQLDMGLHFHRWSVKPLERGAKISVQSFHTRTTRSVIYFVWDWFEGMT